MMMDVWTLYWGLTDILGHPKLSYFVMKALYAPVSVSALHGNTVLHSGDVIEVQASNFGPPQEGVAPRVRIKDGSGNVVREAEFDAVTVAGDISMTALGSMDVTDLAPGLYSVESHLRSGGAVIAKRLELFYLEAAAYSLPTTPSGTG
jgi:hypothetical protein